jgi:hypothetical protein
MRTSSPTRLLAALAASVLLLGACSDPVEVSDDPEPTRGTDSGNQSEEPGATDSPSESPSETDTSSGGAARTVAVYYVGDTERAGPRLYREFQRGEGEALPAAVAALTGSPLDPDYRTLWDGDQVLSAAYEGDVVVVTVDPSVRSRPAGMSRAEARAAVEQAIYTVQAAVQERAPVQFRTEDNPIDQVFGVPTSEPLANGAVLDVLSHANLTTPEQGQVVDDGTLEVSGVGNSFEATLGWEIREGGTVVDRGFLTMDGWMEPKLFPFETSVDVSGLEPGDYTFWVSTDDPSGGTEGFGAMTDDKEFSIE